MKATLPLAVTFTFCCAAFASCFGDDILRNGDLHDGLSAWHGDGHLVYLKADNTEADEAGPDTTPVIKLNLEHDSSEVYQEYETRDTPGSLNVSVDVMAASDFHRSAEKNDYSITWSSGTWYWSALVVPTVDFWIRGGPGMLYYRLSTLKALVWTTVKGHFQGLTATDHHIISFCVPPGTGSVYVKNIAVTP